MVLDPKHFEEIDDFADFDEKIECAEGDFAEVGPNHPLAWRRLIIERAVVNVKKALENKADAQNNYKKGELLYDQEANKFGRVIESSPGLLNLSLVGGGKLVRKNIDSLAFIRENRHGMTLPEMAKKLFLSEIEVISLLNKLELESDKKAPVAEKIVAKKMPVKEEKARQLKVSKQKVVTKPIVNKTAPKFKKLAPSKTSIKAKALPKKQKNNASFAKMLPKGAMTDPIRDPNGYIQQNFLLMSNRELSFATGLSEHTIRRKLGEWNLKRKDYINKA